MKKKHFINIIFPAIFSIILSACVTSASSSGLTGSAWKLLSYGPASQQIQALSDIDTLVAFNPDGLISGSLGCNSFGGKYRAAGGQISFSEMTQTMMACETRVLDQESAVMQIFSSNTRFTLQSGILTITSEDGDSVVIFYAEQK